MCSFTWLLIKKKKTLLRYSPFNPLFTASWLKKKEFPTKTDALLDFHCGLEENKNDFSVFSGRGQRLAGEVVTGPGEPPRCDVVAHNEQVFYWNIAHVVYPKRLEKLRNVGLS